MRRLTIILMLCLIATMHARQPAAAPPTYTSTNGPKTTSTITQKSAWVNNAADGAMDNRGLMTQTCDKLTGLEWGRWSDAFHDGVSYCGQSQTWVPRSAPDQASLTTSNTASPSSRHPANGAS